MFDVISFVPAASFTLVLLGFLLVLGLMTIFSLQKTEFILYALLIWFPLETVVLRYSPSEYYAVIKYLPEVLIYSTLVISWTKYIKRTNRFFPSTPLNLWLLAFLGVALVSLLSNWYNPVIWFLGLRQLLRFVLIFIIFLFEDYDVSVIRNFLWIGAAIVVGESILGLFQYLTGGELDKYLFFTDSISIGPIELEGVQQNWAPGQRVFATLGRYDRLGSLLSIGLVMLFPWYYVLKTPENRERWWGGFIVGVMALVLTYSRASWLAFLAGMFTIGYFLVEDRRLFRTLTIGGIIVAAYLLFVIITQSFGSATVELPGKLSVRDRLVEAVSFYSWQQSYEGYGRFFFIINTPRMVVLNSPLFGVGPGNYGGGVAASLTNTAVYDRLHLPFGIQNSYGQIDNNWLSIWGEFGTLGLLVWIMIFRSIYKSAYYVHKHSEDVIQKTIAQGLCGATISLSVLGFFGPYFEFRSLMVYFWLTVGIALYYFRNHRFAWNFLRE
jgi:hypothetical protein